MITMPVSFLIPAELEAALRRGDLIQHGGILRNQQGRIVKHLKPAHVPRASGQVLARVARMSKDPRVIIATVALGAAAAVAGNAVVKRRREAGEAEVLVTEVPVCVLNYNASLAAYVEAVHEGRLELGVIERLIAGLDEVKAHSDIDGSITLDFSTRQAELLVNLVVDYTKQLAEANSVGLDTSDGYALEGEAHAVSALRSSLEVQRQIVVDVA